MNELTAKLQASGSVEIMKLGLELEEKKLDEFLKKRSWLVKKLIENIQNVPPGHSDYQRDLSYFKRLQSEREVIEVITGYVATVEGLLQAQTAENHKLREKLSDRTMDVLLLRQAKYHKFTKMASLAFTTDLLHYQQEKSKASQD